MGYQPQVGHIVYVPERHGGRLRVIALGDSPHGPTVTVVPNYVNNWNEETWLVDECRPVTSPRADGSTGQLVHPPSIYAERVRRFLHARSGMTGLDPEMINGVADPETARIVELHTSDLAALVRSVLGKNAAVVDETRQGAARKAERETTRLRESIPDILAREAEGARADDETEI